MNEIDQLASAMLAIAFAAVMLVAGQLFIEYRANKYPLVQAVQTPSMPSGQWRLKTMPIDFRGVAR